MEYGFFDNCLIIDTDAKGHILFRLDMREIYDFDDKGRIYNIGNEKGCIIVEYKKYDNNILENLNYTRYLAVKTDITQVENILQWSEVYYPEDEKRKSNPIRLHVFDALKIKCNRKSRIAAAYSAQKEDAIIKAKDAFEKAELSFGGIEKAYEYAKQSFDDLKISFNGFEGYYTGLPWFFQIWTRDEAISLGALIVEQRFDEAKKILLERVKSIEKGMLPNRVPESQLATADGAGWLFKRIFDMKEHFSPEELSLIKGKLDEVLNAQDVDSYLVRNKANETWMDTNYNDDGREGFRIEIQALRLVMLKIAGKDEETRQKVREVFFDGTMLNDGKEDPTARPNIFLAFYIYPELLTYQEWERVFDTAIEKLWLDWGGFATIDKSSPLFCPNYTGEDNKSYHRGDSWFFINNIAAMCLYQVNKEKYGSYIKKIHEASTKDILENGIIGRPSELSSASKQTAESSLFQLWSAATFIEMDKLLNS